LSDEDFGKRAHQVVGVVASTREHGVLAPETAETYWTIRRDMASNYRGATTQMTLLLRTQQADGRSVVDPLRRLMREIDPLQPLYNVWTLERLLFSKLARQRLVLGLMIVFAGVTLVLAAIGMYGLMSYRVSMLRRHMAIMIALGRSPGRVLGSVLGSSLILIGYGSAVGLPIALGWTWFASSRFFAVSGTDTSTCMWAVAFVATVGLAASLVPAWRACRVNPWTVLREE
jgi:putative ABC transport system permease protein